MGIAAEIIPKVPINAGQSLSHGEAVTAPFTQGSLRDGGCGLPRRFAPRNDSPDPLSFRGQCAHWPWESVLFTMDGGSGRRGRRPLRKVYRSPSNGPMWASAPTERNGSPPRLPGQRLAKRKARKEELVKFGFCLMSSECSTAYRVRKSDESPARALVGAASTEQNRLEPRPAARQGASRP